VKKETVITKHEYYGTDQNGDAIILPVVETHKYESNNDIGNLFLGLFAISLSASIFAVALNLSNPARTVNNFNTPSLEQKPVNY